MNVYGLSIPEAASTVGERTDMIHGWLETAKNRPLDYSVYYVNILNAFANAILLYSLDLDDLSVFTG